MIKNAFNSRLYIIAEFLLLCIAVPGYIIATKSAPFMFTFLWSAALYCFVIMRFHYQLKIKEIWRWQAVSKKTMRPLLIRWAIATLAMLAFCAFYDPDRLFYIPRERPKVMVFLLFLYPVLSALPQEFIFCSFFFKRYKGAFGKGALMIAASAIVFAYAHVLYINPVAPTLSLIGGLIFAYDYAKHKSLALVTIEHGLYGNSLFIIGLGWYFYSGSVAQG